MPHLDRMTRIIAAILLPIAVATLVGLVVLCDWVASSDAFDNMPGDG